eukprot:TRINITY_DN9350_c0_g1_i4.p1 TRINITY_DN9350_c0_g1~~TRINITY_DN9350_c0_g1_i4.p1  ORF type:complete len:573 (+),score=140.47 TRINITY_DN9350_c0_g1_i4:82-1800(+)
MSRTSKKLEWHDEDCFMLRLPEQEATQLHKLLENKVNLDSAGYTIDLKGPDPVVTIAGKRMRSKLVNLPAIVEVHKTIDKKHIYKCGDVHQMVICEDPSSEPKQRKDGNEADDESVANDPTRLRSVNWPHGLSRPLKNVRKKRFRKTAPMLQQDPVTEEAVNELLERDQAAMKVTVKESFEPLAQAQPDNDVARLGDVEAEAAAKQDEDKDSSDTDDDGDDAQPATKAGSGFKLTLPGDSNLNFNTGLRPSRPTSPGTASHASTNHTTSIKFKFGGNDVMDLSFDNFDMGSTADTDLGGSLLDDNASVFSASQSDLFAGTGSVASMDDSLALAEPSTGLPSMPPPMPVTESSVPPLIPTFDLPPAAPVATATSFQPPMSTATSLQPPISTTSSLPPISTPSISQPPTLPPEQPTSSAAAPAPPLISTPPADMNAPSLPSSSRPTISHQSESTTGATLPTLPTANVQAQASGPATSVSTDKPPNLLTNQATTTTSSTPAVTASATPAASHPATTSQPATTAMDQAQDEPQSEADQLRAKIASLQAELAKETRKMKMKQLERSIKQLQDRLNGL